MRTYEIIQKRRKTKFYNNSYIYNELFIKRWNKWIKTSQNFSWKCEIPLNDIKKNIDKRITIFENLEKPKEKITRKGNGKQITKLQLARERNKVNKEKNIVKKW